MKVYHVPELVSNGVVQLEKVLTTINMADILTKPASLDQGFEQ